MQPPGQKVPAADSFLGVKITVRALMGIVALVGSTVGFAGALGWRYATRRLVVIDNPPTTTPGSKGFMFTFDTVDVVAGPRWWPGLLLLPATGVVVAALMLTHEVARPSSCASTTGHPLRDRSRLP
ncbi:hypothetical protein LX14_003742 [Williamsia deligens]|nr:hypothetical protein [Williamsia deligens]